VEILSPEAIAESFKSILREGVINIDIYEREVAVKKNRFKRIFITVSREAFRQAVDHLIRIHPDPHLAIIAPSDLGDTVQLTYLFTIYYGNHLQEITLGLRVNLSKNDLKMPTITDLIPGCILTERETQEMMGVEVVGIPDNRRLFLFEGFPEGVHPWRKDETGPQELLRVLPGRQPKK
jgi:membrane-bound hydrogenase subunit beta